MAESGLDDNGDAVDEALRIRRGLRTRHERQWLRQRVGLTQAALGQVIGVPQGMIAKWESGDQTPRGSHARKYVAVLDRLAAEAPEVSESD